VEGEVGKDIEDEAAPAGEEEAADGSAGESTGGDGGAKGKGRGQVGFLRREGRIGLYRRGSGLRWASGPIILC
jgi:hypothetical protein